MNPHEWVNSRIVETTLLTAPPGCGKTEYLARRAAFIVNEGLVKPPQQILALTFSNKATANLSERLQKSLGPSAYRYVEVTNFHKFGFRLIRNHGQLVGNVQGERPLIQAGSLRRIRNFVASEHGINPAELSRQLRVAKCGPYTDDQVIERLKSVSGAALAYEVRIRSEERRDFDDAIRLGLLLAMKPSVAAVYRTKFPIILVDEVQDLSEAQLDLVESIGSGTTTFAGDRAQCIYGFAGAAPNVVYDRILKSNPVLVDLTESYRSAPAVLRVVSWLSIELGGGKIEVATDAEWQDEGDVAVRRFENPRDESAWILGQVKQWQSEDPEVSIGVMVRAGSRRLWLDAAARDAGLNVEIWDYPAHNSSIVNLLRRNVGAAVLEAGEGLEGLDALYLKCFEALELDDTQAHDELLEAIETIRELVERNGLGVVVSQIRHLADPNKPAPAGLHLLNAHLGKGQQFDKVVVLGMEEGHIPSHFAQKSDDLKEELSVLHVMSSRARSSLIYTVCRDVPNKSGEPWIRKPSRWLREIEARSTP